MRNGARWHAGVPPNGGRLVPTARCPHGSPVGKIPVIQDQLVQKSRLAGKPVIAVKNFPESMIENPTPTRAEVRESAYDEATGADSTMRSGETAKGECPSKGREDGGGVAWSVVGWEVVMGVGFWGLVGPVCGRALSAEIERVAAWAARTARRKARMSIRAVRTRTPNCRA